MSAIATKGFQANKQARSQRLSRSLSLSRAQTNDRSPGSSVASFSESTVELTGEANEPFVLLTP